MQTITENDIRIELEDAAFIAELEADYASISKELEELKESYVRFQSYPPTEIDGVLDYEDACAHYECDIDALRGELALIDVMLGR